MTEKEKQEKQEAAASCSEVCNAATKEPALTIETLKRAMKELTEPPTVLAMHYRIIIAGYLSSNTILVSKDLAELMEQTQMSETVDEWFEDLPFTVQKDYGIEEFVQKYHELERRNDQLEQQAKEVA